ncbi:MAG TPA: cardiolipin synthase [Clostridiaceae bacterium]|nr:cardiolipin synthase [Clostridiaceae bacterium]
MEDNINQKKKKKKKKSNKSKNTFLKSLKSRVDNRAYKIKIPGMIRLGFVLFLLIAIIIINVLIAVYLSKSAFWIYLGLQVISLIFVLFVIHQDRNSSYVLAWAILILAVPVAGLSIFLLWGRRSRFKKEKIKFSEIENRINKHLVVNPQLLNNLILDYPESKLFATFLYNSGFPVYQNTVCQYFSLGEDKFVQMFEDLRKAKDFIFMEYFILADGVIWQEVENILIQKAHEGVDVRLLFDDFGSIIKAPNDVIKKLRSNGVKVYNFNPVVRYISKLYINYRNHQKCCIIDGNLAYTGGTNLADEYANLYPRFGHWKDSAIRLEGDAVRGLTTMFLIMWEFESNIQENDYGKYMPRAEYYQNAEGYFIPYWDSPLNNLNNPAEDIYRSMINNAKDYLYICTPYFIVDDSMISDLCRAAKSGVDVRIITPGIPDKWYAYVVTQSNYAKLMEGGVKVFQYSPGFIHGKTVIADDFHAITGCVNFDFRSFHLHFENSVYICGNPVLRDIYVDLLDIFKDCELMDLETWQQRPLKQKAIEAFMRIFSTLL